MPSQPEVIAKGSILRRLEAAFNNRPNRPPILAALQAGTPLLTITSTAPHDLGLTAGERTHLQQDWLTNPNWLAQPADGVVRQALVTALLRAMNPATGAPPPGPPGHQLDIDFYWMCWGTAPPGGKPLEVSISWNPRQVTVIFVTPEAPRRPGRTPNLEDIMVVKPDAAGAPQVVRVPYE